MPALLVWHDEGEKTKGPIYRIEVCHDRQAAETELYHRRRQEVDVVWKLFKRDVRLDGARACVFFVVGRKKVKG